MNRLLFLLPAAALAACQSPASAKIEGRLKPPAT